MTRIALVLTLCLSGCASLHSQYRTVGYAPSPEYCERLDSRFVTTGAIAAGAALGAGTSGLSTIATENRDARLALALTSVGLAMVSAAAGFASQQSASSYARDCK